MPIPDFQSVMLPLMKYASDDKEHTLRETSDCLAKEFNLTEEEKTELLPSGSQAIFDNRVGWAKTHLSKAGLLFSPRRSVFTISERGKQVLQSNPPIINMAFLRQFPEYVEFTKPARKNGSHSTTGKNEERLSDNTPEEALEYAYQEIKTSLAEELLGKVKSSPSDFFERLVVELLVKMGYGGSLKDAGRATRKVKDEGIDGIIKEDKLGLDVIYVQAKRWEGSVGRPEIQKFVGALAGQGANKGIFITTSCFSNDALNYIPRNDTKIVLIDGQKLAEYMIEYNVGVTTVKSFEIKKIDSDYFEM
ncbi:MAG: restriction endonuclease [Ignavibacteria bacterium]|jgi:restriction system protein|nr:restriction endonuclease [Ignavibacteria bacterium]MCU7519090.1 restriction endonuclease [Ignavibacteria bacterium]